MTDKGSSALLWLKITNIAQSLSAPEIHLQDVTMTMSPVCFLLSSVLILMIISVTTATNCPDPARDEWKTKDLECNSGTKYHCLSGEGATLRMDMCAVPVNCTPGTHALLDESTETVSCVPCSPDMYQLTSKPSYKFIQPNCDYRKTPCKLELGELQCGAATSSQNYQCKCDYTKGFKPNIIEKGCECFAKDSSKCQCVEANCIEGEVLAANFSCIADAPTTTTSTTVSTTQMSSDTSGESLSKEAIVGIAFGSVVSAIVIIGIVIYLVLKRKGRCKRQPDDKRKKYQGENVNTHEEEPLKERSEGGNAHGAATTQQVNKVTGVNESTVTNATTVGQLHGDNIVGTNTSIHMNFLCCKANCCEKMK